MNKPKMYIKDGVSEIVAIRNIVKHQGYSDEIADALCYCFGKGNLTITSSEIKL